MSEEVFSKEFWRLGHRRRWWQWNVITLFVPLFLLVWMRELLRLTQPATWLMSLAVLTAWFLAPMLLIQAPENGGGIAGSKADAPPADGLRFGYLLASATMFGCVLLVGGAAAGAFSVLAAMLYAAAVKRDR
jgi:hypothetical protein